MAVKKFHGDKRLEIQPTVASKLLWEGMEDSVEYQEKLRAVFDLFDTEKRGYITVDHFVDLAREHFGAEDTESQVSPRNQQFL